MKTSIELPSEILDDIVNLLFVGAEAIERDFNENDYTNFTLDDVHRNLGLADYFKLVVLRSRI